MRITWPRPEKYGLVFGVFAYWFIVGGVLIFSPLGVERHASPTFIVVTVANFLLPLLVMIARTIDKLEKRVAQFGQILIAMHREAK